MKDSKGNTLKIGDSVLVPPPNSQDDLHSNEFAGHIDSFHGEYATVMDGDGDCFDIEPNRLTIYDEEDNKKMVAGFLKSKLN